MKRSINTILALLLVMLFVNLAVLEQNACARAGGGRSFGSSGGRSYSAPSRNYSSPSAPSRQATPAPAQPGGGFLRSMGGGLLGGMLGGMLFSSLGFGGTGGFGGGGIGVLEIILLGVGGYMVYSMVMRKRRESALAYQSSSQQVNYGTQEGSLSTVDGGVDLIRRMDPSFDESRFKDTTMDIFFKIQGAWTNRDLSTGSELLTGEMKGILQRDIDALLQEKRTNKLDNIAVRNVEIVEAWQEAGQDYVKALFTANLLDYTTDDATGSVVAGSRNEPVKFQECWTFTRTVGNNPWKLSAISQV